MARQLTVMSNKASVPAGVIAASGAIPLRAPYASAGFASG